MKKIYCDACHEECTDSYTHMEFPYHIIKEDDIGYAVLQHGMMVPVSGRMETYELCLLCYNKAYAAAYAVIKGDK